MRFGHCRLERIFNICELKRRRVNYNGSVYMANSEYFCNGNDIFANMVRMMRFSGDVSDVVDGDWRYIP